MTYFQKKLDKNSKKLKFHFKKEENKEERKERWKGIKRVDNSGRR